LKNFVNSISLKILLVFTLAVTLVPSGFVNSVQADSFVTPLNGSASNVEVVKGKLAREFVKKSKEKINSQKLYKISLDELNLNKPKVMSLENGLYFVQFNVKKSSDLDKFSNVTVVFDEKKNIVSFGEQYLKLLDEETAEFVMYENGNELYNETLHKPDVQPQFSWSVLNNCLASQGISWTVIAVIGVVCTFACTLGGPAGCAWCIITETAATGSVVSVCVKKAFEA
jgi:hypothetical protein